MAIGKRLRFEILRRDNHTCRYCGAKAPNVELRVDHVIPEALGGTNDPANLVTACHDCNSGKASIAPDQPLVADVERDALRWARAMQAAARSYELDLLERAEQDQEFRAQWEHWTVTNTGKPVPLPDDWQHTVRRLRAAGLTNALISEAIDAAMHANGVYAENRFRYFCGVAWRIVTQLHERARAAVGAEQPEDLPEMPTHTLEGHIADALDYAGAHLDPWVYDEFVLNLAARMRGEA